MTPTPRCANPACDPTARLVLIAGAVGPGWRPGAGIEAPPLAVWKCTRCKRFLWTPTSYVVPYGRRKRRQQEKGLVNVRK